MMTRKQFEKFRVEIEAKKFRSVEMNPIAYGIERLIFEKEKLKTLIAAAEAIPMKTTVAKADRWKRKLKRADLSIVRLQNTPVHTSPAKIDALDRQNLNAILGSSQTVATIIPSRKASSASNVRV